MRRGRPIPELTLSEDERGDLERWAHRSGRSWFSYDERFLTGWTIE